MSNGELESSLQQFGEFLLKAQLVRETVALHFVRRVRRFLPRPALDEQGRTSPLAALEQSRTRLRTRHYPYRTQCPYAGWVRRFLTDVAEQQGGPHPRVERESVRDFLAHLAVRQNVSASTQNQAFCAILFL